MPTVVLPLKVCTRFDLPPVCVVTGETEDVVWKTINFRARNGSIVPIDLPFTEAAFASWIRSVSSYPTRVMLAYVALVVFSIAATHELEGLVHMTLPQIPLMICLMVGAAPLLYGYVVKVRRSGPVLVALDEHTLTLKVPSEVAARALAERAASTVAPSVLPAARRCLAHANAATFVCSRCGDFGCVPCLGAAPAEPFLCEPCGRVRVSEQARFAELARARSGRQAVLFGAIAVAVAGTVFALAMLLR